jgi:protein-tyrosine phosphatase
MCKFVDIHCHALCGVDDGARDEKVMYAMLESAYRSGTRAICFTPHYGLEDLTPREQLEEVFQKARAYCETRFPDLALYLGNELTYHFSCRETMLEKRCLTLAQTRYVLVDFFTARDVSTVLRGVEELFNAGYLPIVAHVERYDFFWNHFRDVIRLSETGALLQVNASSILKGGLSGIARTTKRLLSEGLADVVASDAHDEVIRPPVLSEAYAVVCEKYDEAYAKILFSENPSRILAGERIFQNL